MPVDSVNFATGEPWNPAAETMSESERKTLQGERLRAQVAYTYERSALLSERYREMGLRPEDVQDLDDLAKMPIVSKDDVRARRAATGDPFGGIACVPRAEFAFVNHSTGTSGAPTVFGATPGDVERMSELYGRAMHAIGVRAGDAMPISGTTFWHGVAIGYELGARRVGATPVRIGAPNPASVEMLTTQWSDFAFDCLRTYIPELELPFLSRAGITPAQMFPSARFVYAGFDVSTPKRRLIEQAFGLPFRNTVGSGDQFFVGAECAHSVPWLHMCDDDYIFEVLDGDTWEPAPDGIPGELVVTNLRAEACPLIRYRMDDIVTLDHSPCACGRTSVRMRVLGRVAWSVNVGGRRIFSSDVEEAVWSEPGLAGAPYQLVRSRPQPQERLLVRLAEPPEGFGEVGPLSDERLATAEQALRSRLDVDVEVTLVDPEEIGLQGPIKLQRIIDID